MEKNRLGLKLLELRQKHYLTQRQLCEDLNISRANYSYFENGRRVPDINTLLLFAQYYKVSLDDLAGTPRLPHDAAGLRIQDAEIGLIRHLKAKRIPTEAMMELSKADFDFLMNYQQLSADNKAEMEYLINYKLRKQSK
ncbi:MAG: helix-turn-helix transcriptional regulator [Lachnospiraceae bacterium]